MKKVIVLVGCLISVGAMPAMANNADNFRDNDPIGWMMSIIAMGVVFFALIVLFLSFKYIYPACTALGLRVKKSIHRKKQYEQISDRRSARVITVKEKSSEKEVDDEELVAAIGVALFLNEDGMHDQEPNVLTLTPSTSNWTGAGQNQKHSPVRRF